MMLGLVTPTSGQALINGRRYVDLERPVVEVGAALEATGFNPGRSARDHLRIACTAAGLPTRRADEALEATGLKEAADRRVLGFSLGMRQRLALAEATLGEPRVLILDEPANGLDPAGIRWLRDFLRHLADIGCTVLVSSHVLAEVEQVADHVVIVARGRVLRDAPLAELVRGGELKVGTRQPEQLRRALEEAGAAVRFEDDRLWVSGVDAEQVGRAALDAGAVLTELVEERSGLEHVFLELTRAEMGEAG
ncbi:ATP-binding cassette domain-containing protein [Actinomadura keratinilytica]